MKKGIASFVVAAIVVIMLYSVSLAQAETGTVIKSANIRSGPGVTYSIVGAAKPGQVVTIIGVSPNKEWTKIGPGHWIASFLIGRDPVAPAVTPTKVPTRVPTPTRVPVKVDRASDIIDAFEIPSWMTVKDVRVLARYAVEFGAVSFSEVAFESPSVEAYAAAMSFSDQESLGNAVVQIVGGLFVLENCVIVEIPRYAGYGCASAGKIATAIILHHNGEDLLFSRRSGPLDDFADNAADAILDMDRLVEIAQETDR